MFLTEKREAVLNGEYDGSDDALRNQKSRLRRSAQTALQELITVAASPEIENAEVFDPEQIHILLKILLTGRGGLVGDDVPADLEAWHPAKEYRNEMYVAIDQVLRNTEENAENSGLYQMLGEKAQNARKEE